MKKIVPANVKRPASRYLLRVNPNGRPVGIEEKEKCHAGNGIWHSAFLVMVFDEADRLMQAQRSRAKTLWPDYWDGTVASHFYPGEDQDMIIRRRLSEEIGVTCGSLEYLFKFSYQSRYREVGIEKEICHVFRASRIRARDVSPDAAEVAQFRFSSLRDLSQEVSKNAEVFTPWFLLAYRQYLQRIG
ncbi:MAG TPA: NUDIX domain-containing protein [Candidatus Desulfaltia sp.]|nr:NUDIX domain-containing protein [Candidatus Desulfaltia sp.]